jgi:hypothetical protein
MMNKKAQNLHILLMGVIILAVVVFTSGFVANMLQTQYDDSACDFTYNGAQYFLNRTPASASLPCYNSTEPENSTWAMAVRADATILTDGRDAVAVFPSKGPLLALAMIMVVIIGLIIMVVTKFGKRE